MAYEEARKLRVEENFRRLQGIAKISKDLTQISTKTPKQHIPRPSVRTISVALAEPRRSSRARTNIPSYRDDLDVDISRSLSLRKSRHNSSWANYIARPLDECKCASYEERLGPLKAAEEFQSSLGSQNPSFVKSMVRSHVYSCFWLGLPSTFCVAHLPEETVDIVLEDENGKEYDAVYIGKRSGISSGWRGFALEHKLDDGDALVFHMVEPQRFKVYVFRGDEKANLTTAGKRQREEDKDVEELGDVGGSSGSTKRSSKRLLRKRRS